MGVSQMGLTKASAQEIECFQYRKKDIPFVMFQYANILCCCFIMINDTVGLFYCCLLFCSFFLHFCIVLGIIDSEHVHMYIHTYFVIMNMKLFITGYYLC